MTEPPPLPNTNDPFELLGVDRDADARTIRRAYTRSIRVYRAERFPMEFQRLRAAYESLRDSNVEDRPIDLGWRGTRSRRTRPEDVIEGPSPSARGRFETKPTVPEDAATPTGGLADEPEIVRDPEVSRLRDVETAFEPEPGEPTPSGPHPAGDAEKAPSPTPLQRHARSFLEAESLGDSKAAIRALESGLREVPEFADWMLRALDETTLTVAAGGAGLAWSVLHELEAPDDAASLFQYRCHALIWSDRMQVLVDELSSRSFRRAARRVPALAALGIEAACTLAWNDPDAADRLVELFRAQIQEDPDFEYLVDRYMLTRSAAVAWSAWRERGRCPALLARYIRLGSAANGPAKSELIRELGADALLRPGVYRRFLTRLRSTRPAIADILLATLERESSLDPDPTPISAETRDQLLRFLDGLTARMRRTGARRALDLVSFAGLVGAVPAHMYVGPLALSLCVFVSGTGIYMLLREHAGKRAYRRHAEPALVRFILRSSIHSHYIERHGSRLPIAKVHRPGDAESTYVDIVVLQTMRALGSLART